MKQDQLLDFLKCIADETRFKILKLLLDNQFCVCQLTPILNKSQSSISQHLASFKELDLLVEKKEQKWIYYSIDRNKYDQYLGLVVGLNSLDFTSLGLEPLQKRLDQVRETDISDLRKRID